MALSPQPKQIDLLQITDDLSMVDSVERISPLMDMVTTEEEVEVGKILKQHMHVKIFKQQLTQLQLQIRQQQQQQQQQLK